MFSSDLTFNNVYAKVFFHFPSPIQNQKYTINVSLDFIFRLFVNIDIKICLAFCCSCESLNILISCSKVVVVVIVVCKLLKKAMRGIYFMFTLKTYHIAGIWQVKYSCIMWRFTSLNIIIKGLSFNPVYYKCYQKFENPTFVRTYIHYV